MPSPSPAQEPCAVALNSSARGNGKKRKLARDGDELSCSKQQRLSNGTDSAITKRISAEVPAAPIIKEATPELPESTQQRRMVRVCSSDFVRCRAEQSTSLAVKSLYSALGLRQRLKIMDQESPLPHDLTFLVGALETPVRMHSFLVSMASDVLATMVDYARAANPSDPVIRLPDLTEEGFQIIKTHINTEIIAVEYRLMPDIAAFAEAYNMKQLSLELRAILQREFRGLESVSAYQRSIELVDEAMAEGVCDLIRINMDFFKNSQVLKLLTAGQMKVLLEIDSLNASENCLADMLWMWAVHKVEAGHASSTVEAVGELRKLLDVAQIDPKVLANKNLLTETETLQFLRFAVIDKSLVRDQLATMGFRATPRSSARIELLEKVMIRVTAANGYVIHDYANMKLLIKDKASASARLFKLMFQEKKPEGFLVKYDKETETFQARLCLIKRSDALPANLQVTADLNHEEGHDIVCGPGAFGITATELFRDGAACVEYKLFICGQIIARPKNMVPVGVVIGSWRDCYAALASVCHDPAVKLGKTKVKIHG